MRRSSLKRVLAALVTTALLPVVAREFFARETGREYGVGTFKKLQFLALTIRNNIRVESASNFLYHLIMAGKILQIPKDLPGDFIECGSFKGGSAVNLSRLASWTGRRLHLFDSFEGLPTPTAEDAEHLVLSELTFNTYEGGAYAGSLPEVRENIRKYGVLGVCEFHRGFFNETLPRFDQQLVFADIDADLTSPVPHALKHAWPLLQQAATCSPTRHTTPRSQACSTTRPGGRANSTPPRPGSSAAATVSACCCTPAASAAPSDTPPSSRRTSFPAGPATPHRTLIGLTQRAPAPVMSASALLSFCA